jgi:hypothetical protein
MYFHVFGFKWKPEATEALRARAAEAILEFRREIPGLLEVAVGPNDSPRGMGYAFVGVMRFTEKAAFEAYVGHPTHVALLQWLVPLIEPVELDFTPIGV